MDMYPAFIVAEEITRLMTDRYPFYEMDERTLADLGIDRYGRFIDPEDTRIEAAPPSKWTGLFAWLSAVPLGLGRHRPAH
jgi:hypothetical protein